MLPQPVEYVLERLENAGFAAFAVGGCVRDTLLGRVPGDWDVTTAARPEQVLALFDGCAIPTGLKHGTVTVRAEGMGIEVTTFRADGTYTDHRRPDAVTFSWRLEDDLSRRDLTVNAMAMDRRGQITDLFGGRDDLKAGVLRCVGDPERRFREDALRILRTLRFAAVLGFAIEPRTAAALHETAPLLTYIAPERILSEMDRALCVGHILPVLLDYPDVLAVFLPEIAPCVGFDQCNRHHIYDVWGHSAHAAAAIAPEPVLCCMMWASPPASPVTSRAWGIFTGTRRCPQSWRRARAAACGWTAARRSASSRWCAGTTGISPGRTEPSPAPWASWGRTCSASCWR